MHPARSKHLKHKGEELDALRCTGVVCSQEGATVAGVFKYIRRSTESCVSTIFFVVREMPASGVKEEKAGHTHNCASAITISNDLKVRRLLLLAGERGGTKNWKVERRREHNRLD